MSTRVWLVLVLATACVIGGAAGCHLSRAQAHAETPPAEEPPAKMTPDAKRQPPPGSMAGLVDGLAAAFAVSLDDDDEAASRKALGDALSKLTSGSQLLVAHGQTMGKSNEVLRVAIARDAYEASVDFEAGRLKDAERRVHQLVDNCFACHTSDAAANPSGLGDAMAQLVDLERLDLKEQVYFLVASRQFETALSRIEAALVSPEAPQRTTWLFEAYLKLSIRTDGSYARAQRALKRFLNETDVTPYHAGRVQRWIASLIELEKAGGMKDDLASARMLIERGRELNEFPADKRGLVHFVAATGVLQRYLAAHDEIDSGVAEAYYLLGRTESHVSTTLWNDQTGFFLETAIRLRPHSALSENAYAFLQEYEIFRYSGASSTYIPDAVQRHLDELGALATR